MRTPALRVWMAAAVTLAGLTTPLTAQSDPVPAGMLRYPDVSQNHIVFSYANDLWLVSRKGGVATPLASPDGSERFPRFSADGNSIAFVGNYEGNTDIYTIPAVGGVAERVTYHPTSETLCDWLPNGQLLFYAHGRVGIGAQAKVCTVDPSGAMAKELPIPYGTVSAISADGKWLAYTPNTRDGRTWKRYQGGLATDIWLFNLEDHSAEKITDWAGTDTQPMWWENTLYYLSDAGEHARMNIWKYSLRTKKHTQATFYEHDDIKWPAIGPGFKNQGEIVYQLGSDLMLYNIKMKRDSKVEVFIPGEKPNVRHRDVDASKFIQDWDVSPTGKRAVAQARGDIWSLPSEKGIARNLTRTNGVAERTPSWSPDGRWVAYFSDKTGEYEIWMTQSDGKGETKQLTSEGGLFKTAMFWSPDSKKIAYLDCGGNLRMHDLDSGETKLLDESRYGFWIGAIGRVNWSHDSRLLTYAKVADKSSQTAIWILNTEDGSKKQVTSGFFADGSPTFDRKGKYLFYTSGRNFSPSYSSVDMTYIYDKSTVLMAVPLQAESDRLWAPENDEEEWEEEEEAEEGKEEGDGEKDGDAKEEGESEGEENGDDEGEQEAAPADALTGSWAGTLTGPEMPPEGVPLTVNLKLASDGSVTGDMVTPLGTATIDQGTFNKGTGELKLELTADLGFAISVTATVSGENMKGKGAAPDQGITFDFELTRESSGSSGDGGDDDGDDEEAAEKVEIDYEGFEARAIQLPVSPGNIGGLQVNHKGQVIYGRYGTGGGIKLFDLEDDSKNEKSVASGGGFTLTADGKKMMIARGSSASIQAASAGGSGKTVPTKGMMVRINPQEEWAQLFTDAWRIFRDYFYDPNLHGVDWQWVHDHYSAMIKHCASREDVTFLIGEMISEVNAGHAYIGGNGDGAARAPRVGIGMLGVDWELHEGAYRIANIVRGADWDSDGRGPLSMPGVDVNQGDYVLAVNGVPMDASRSPYAAFQGLSNKEIMLTVSAKPTMDDEAREVLVKTISSERSLRYRAWIERNRKYVEEKSGGRLGYLYVPNTGIAGQNDLYRQFFGQTLKEGLIIDERWNGGGQIPNRFIELLNRPVSNYWATRGTQDIHWPPDSHQGPKCMLINENAGSGGDAFPAYFRQAGLGKLIGKRTWGGLIGISGNPSLIDGGSITVPTFGYYSREGGWSIEGYGVDPDIEVVDDPSLMTEGGDPQLDAAIQHMMEEVDRIPFNQPGRPAYPDRSGHGIDPAHK